MLRLRSAILDTLCNPACLAILPAIGSLSEVEGAALKKSNCRMLRQAQQSWTDSAILGGSARLQFNLWWNGLHGSLLLFRIFRSVPVLQNRQQQLLLFLQWDVIGCTVCYAIFFGCDKYHCITFWGCERICSFLWDNSRRCIEMPFIIWISLSCGKCNYTIAFCLHWEIWFGWTPYVSFVE